MPDTSTPDYKHYANSPSIDPAARTPVERRPHNPSRAKEIIRTAWHVDRDEDGAFILTRPRRADENDKHICLYAPVVAEEREAVVALVANAGRLLQAAENYIVEASIGNTGALILAIQACGGEVRL